MCFTEISNATKEAMSSNQSCESLFIVFKSRDMLIAMGESRWFAGRLFTDEKEVFSFVDCNNYLFLWLLKIIRKLDTEPDG